MRSRVPRTAAAPGGPHAELSAPPKEALGDIYRSLFEAAGDGVLVIDDQGRAVDCNPYLLEQLRTSREQILGSSPCGFSPDYQPDGRRSEQAATEVLARTAAGERVSLDWLGLRGDGTPINLEVTVTRIEWDGRAWFVALHRDVTERHRIAEALRLSEEKFSKLYDVSPDPMILSEIETGRIFDINPAFSEVFGYRREAVVGRTTVEVGLWARREDREATVAAMQRHGQLRNHEVVFRTADGGLRTVLGSSARVVIEGLSCWIVQFRDITEQKAQQQALEHMALHDSLTGLPNRQQLKAHLDVAVTRLQAHGTGFALMLLDLDGFKEINDTLGHHVGDQLLRELAPRLEAEAARRGGLVARLGGDEFALLWPGPLDAAAAEERAGEVLSAVREPFRVRDLQLNLTGSLGIALAPRDGRDGAALLRCADVAMYVAKRGMLDFSHYAPEIDANSPLRLTILSDIGKAISAGQLRLLFQPKVRLWDGSLAGWEALVRWEHPVHGLLPPGVFVPVVEMSELVQQLTDWVIEDALRALSSSFAAGPRTTVAVNLSARNLVNEKLPGRVAELLRRYAVAPGRLELEVTETAVMADPQRAYRVLRRLSALGVRLAIDDFGTGYSSLLTLRQMPRVQALKVDQAFVQRITRDSFDVTLVRTMVDLAQKLGMEAVAEGVERADTLKALQAIGCDLAQGYYLARPLAEAAAAAWTPPRLATV